MYVITAPDTEPRLQRRYRQLVQQHLSTAQNLAAGLRQLPTLGASWAAAQAAWRFYANPRVTLPQLAAPLTARAHQAVAAQCQDYVLAPLDWSPLHYTEHASKTDRIVLYNKNDYGYLLHAVLALSDVDGSPLAPLALGVEAADGLHASWSATPLACGANLDEALSLMQAVQALALPKPVVYLLDREADSVWHLRQFAADGQCLLIRSNDVRRVEHAGVSCLLSAVEATLAAQFEFTRTVTYEGKKARQYVAETTVTLTQPARRQRRRADGTTGYQMLKGAALTLRYIVAQVRDDAGQVLATWRLWSNLPATVSAATLALWYYWRWRIETCFKLLKRAGQQLEQWQQESAAALAKRLLIAAQACVIVWALQAETADPQALALRRLVLDLSGRLLKRDVAHTAPALFAGLWNLLAIIDALERYPLQELQQAGQTLLAMLGTQAHYQQFKEHV